jgi:hypothetical protein
MKFISLSIGLLLSAVSFAISANENALIEKIQSDANIPSPNIYKWRYKGKVFYEVSTTSCCDIPRMLYDQNGKAYCTLGGGFANRIDPQCADFYKKGSAKLLDHLTATKPQK